MERFAPTNGQHELAKKGAEQPGQHQPARAGYVENVPLPKFADLLRPKSEVLDEAEPDLLAPVVRQS